MSEIAQPRVGAARESKTESRVQLHSIIMNSTSGSRRSISNRSGKTTAMDKNDSKKTLSKQSSKSISSDVSSSNESYIPIQVGDCVVLNSGDDYGNNFIALVSALHFASQKSTVPTSFTAQWYYRPEDVPSNLLKYIDGGVLDSEVFLSNDKDKNTLESVLEKCQVVSEFDYKDRVSVLRMGLPESEVKEKVFICRYKYYRQRTKTPFELISPQDIRSGLGPAQPNIGNQYQAVIPAMLNEKELVFRRHQNNLKGSLCLNVWDLNLAVFHGPMLDEYLCIVDRILFSAGNIVKTYSRADRLKCHVRSIILKNGNNGIVEICDSDGDIRIVEKDCTSTKISQDKILYYFCASKCNISQAVYLFSSALIAWQDLERELFEEEVKLHVARRTLLGSDHQIANSNSIEVKNLAVRKKTKKNSKISVPTKTD